IAPATAATRLRGNAMADKGPKKVSNLAWAGRRSLLGSFAFSLPRVYLLILLVPTLLLLIGTFGYSTIEEDCSLFDGLYMTVITPTRCPPTAASSPFSSCWEESSPSSGPLRR